jgi:probable HAF family extracellular repeat protein
MNRHNVFSAMAVLFWMACGAPATAQSSFEAVDLGTLGGFFSQAVAINDNGQVVGWSFLADNTTIHAFSWTKAGGMVDLTPGADYSSAAAVNASGQVVGSTNTTGFSWTQAGGIVDIGSLTGWGYTYPAALNANGLVVGYSLGVEFNGCCFPHAFSWTPASGSGGSTFLGVLTGTCPPYTPIYTCSVATALNDSGQIVGYSNDHAFLWTQAGGIVDLTPSGVGGQALGVNAIGQVVGDNNAHAFSWTSGSGLVDLGTLGDAVRSHVTAVNNSGQVVGWSYGGPSGLHDAFLWTQTGGMIDLGVISGTTVSEAYAINPTGQVVGVLGAPGGINHAFTWTQAGGIVDLTPNSVSGWATSVNASGQIAGFSTPDSGFTHATLWQAATVSYQICPLYASNVAKKSGSVYPIKIRLCDSAGNNMSASSIVVHAVSVTKTSTNVPGELNDTGNANPDFDFRYDPTLEGYVFNLSTKGYSTGTYNLNFTAGADPATHAAAFAVK